MNNLSFKRVGLALSATVVILHVVGMLRIAMLTGAQRQAAEALMAIAHPGASVTPLGALVVLVEAFVYAWVIAAVFVTVYNAVQDKKM
jgi:uncharacterized membrane protein (DUF485 family)